MLPLLPPHQPRLLLGRLLGGRLGHLRLTHVAAVAVPATAAAASVVLRRRRRGHADALPVARAPADHSAPASLPSLQQQQQRVEVPVAAQLAHADLSSFDINAFRRASLILRGPDLADRDSYDVGPDAAHYATGVPLRHTVRPPRNVGDMADFVRRWIAQPAGRDEAFLGACLRACRGAEHLAPQQRVDAIEAVLHVLADAGLRPSAAMLNTLLMAQRATGCAPRELVSLARRRISVHAGGPGINEDTIITLLSPSHHQYAYVNTELVLRLLESEGIRLTARLFGYFARSIGRQPRTASFNRSQLLTTLWSLAKRHGVVIDQTGYDSLINAYLACEGSDEHIRQVVARTRAAIRQLRAPRPPHRSPPPRCCKDSFDHAGRRLRAHRSYHHAPHEILRPHRQCRGRQSARFADAR